MLVKALIIADSVSVNIKFECHIAKMSILLKAICELTTAIYYNLIHIYSSCTI